jgi:uncharacterized protein (AIM24 family)
LTYHIEGELVPVLTVELKPGKSIIFEHHIVLWKHGSVDIGVRRLKGALKRMVAGMEILLTEARGEGQIAFSRDDAGHVLPIHLKRGEGLHVREHQFLAASGSLSYTFERVKGISNLLFGGTGLFIDKFSAQHEEAILWLHGYGNVFEKVLAPGEQIDVEPGGWLYKDPSVKMETVFSKLAAGLLGGNQLPLNRFTGPGRLGLQTLYYRVPDANEGSTRDESDFITDTASKLLGPAAGGVVAWLIKLLLSR